MPLTVRVPPQFAAIFDMVEEHFRPFFENRQGDPTKGTIEISGERFVLVRGAALSVEFFDIVRKRFAHVEGEAAGIVRQVLFDIAHGLGRADAKHFHETMGLHDPVSKLSAGPIYFSHAGWAFVDIFAESRPEPNENYYLIYDHLYSFEADAWIRAGRRSDFPVCSMNSGYASGWCEESFGLPLVATEISCRAKGDDACRFIMAPPDRVEAYVAQYLGRVPEPAEKISQAEVWKTFTREWTREALLKKSLADGERDYRSLFNVVPDSIIIWDTNGIIQAANNGSARLLGYDKPEELVGQGWANFVAPEDAQACTEDLQKNARSGSIGDLEFAMLRKDGSRIFVQGRASIVLDDAGYPARFIAVARNITERKKAEAALYLSEARFRSTFNDAGHGMALVGKDGRFLIVNPAFCRILGYSQDEMRGRSFLDITHKEDLAESIRAYDRMRSGAISQAEMEKRYVRKDGSIVWVQLNVSWVRDEAGTPVHQVCQVQDITARKAAEAELRAQAAHDQLTGLPNRPAFLERLHEAFALSKRCAKDFAVLFLDLDGFKDVNDTLGHPEGDRLLQLVATRLRSNVRESDIVARFGGDEFAVLQTEMNDPSDAGVLAAKLVKLLSTPYRVDSSDIHITVSVGIACYDPAGLDAGSMLVQADLALYRAKEEGRNRYCFHSTELDRAVHERVALTNELREALSNHGLELYYQPQVELASGRIVGLEALIRWNHPQRGLLLPDTFVPISERSGSIVPLGHWVLDEACRQLKAWRDQGITPPLMAINVSAAQLRGGSELEHDFIACLQRWGVSPGDLELELTESVLMETSQKHGDVLARLKELGTSIAIDDFGTGHSSLAYLSTYPVARLKIAQQFILGIPESSRDIAITNVTLTLARELGIKVIAEGVQTKAQRDFLLAAGCLTGQGFYFSKPVKAERVTEFLRQGVIEPAGES
jgi:diguanylate cyclase (GGDEF)-like protein/PAS domain S-box-containing protein